MMADPRGVDKPAHASRRQSGAEARTSGDTEAHGGTGRRPPTAGYRGSNPSWVHRAAAHRSHLGRQLETAARDELVTGRLGFRWRG